MRGCAVLQLSAMLGCCAAAGADDVQFTLRTWATSEGGTGATYAVAVSTEPWRWHDARDLAAAVQGRLVAVSSPAELAFVCGFAASTGGFDCVGPWIGGYRSAGGAWAWSDGTGVGSFGWEPSRPAQAAALDAALCLAGDGSPSGTWIDVLPSPDAGTHVRSAVIRWNSFTDCDADGQPDALQIYVNPALDANHDGALDGCPATRPADINLDGHVNGADLGLLLGAWGTDGSDQPRADINRDGRVDGSDLGLLLGSWTG